MSAVIVDFTLAAFAAPDPSDVDFDLSSVAAPVVSSLVVSGVTDTGADIDFSVDIFAYLWIVVTTSATVPSHAQIVAGQDHTGAAAAWSTTDSGSGARSYTATGLSVGTGHYVHVASENIWNLEGTIVSSSLFTTTGSGTSTPSITTASLADANFESAYSETLAATAGGGSPASPAWTIDFGVLPTGLSLDGTTGAITGTAGAPVVSTPLSWSVVSGSLPPGVTLGGSFGELTGTPTTIGTSNFTVRVTDAYGTTADQAFTVEVVSNPEIVEASLGELSTGIAFSLTLTTVDAEDPVTWAVEAGDSLPAGLSLNASTGEVSGTPTTAGAYSTGIRATDAQGNSDIQVFTGTVLLNTAPVIDQTSLPGAPLDDAYSTQLTATGGDGALTWSVTAGSLPTGLSLSSAGLISGTATVAGDSTFTVQVSDADAETDTQELTISVAGVTAPPDAPISTPTVTVGIFL